MSALLCGMLLELKLREYDCGGVLANHDKGVPYVDYHLLFVDVRVGVYDLLDWVRVRVRVYQGVVQRLL